MTPEELDEARVCEARRIVQDRHPAHMPQVNEVAREAARLAREGWQPPEPVDPDLLAAREWMASRVIAEPLKKTVVEGLYDHSSDIRAYLAGCTRGREGAKGLEFALKQIVARIENPHLSPDASVVLEQAYAALASAKRGGRDG